MKIFSRYRLLILVVLVGAFLRLWQLGNIPPSPDWDEAALGYNAYSILKTGRDEYGVYLPIVLRSFDDYKPPLYVYLTIPSIALFGLNTWSVRLPSAIMGILAIVGTYLLVLELVKHTGKDKVNLWSHVPLASAALLSISPWHIQFSRIAFEANTGVTLNIWAVVTFFYGLRSGRWLALSALFSGLALYAYHSERLFLPLLMLCLTVIFRKELFAHKKSVFVNLVIGILTILPLVPVIFDRTSVTRLTGTSSLADQTMLLANNVKKLDYDWTHGIFWGAIFDNRRLVWLQTVAKGYLSHYSFRWLFITGDNPRHHAPDMALLYLWELPFFLWGMFQVTKAGGKMAKILWSWFLLAPVAASPTTELPHAIRTLVFLPVFQLFTGVGIINFWNLIKLRPNMNKVIILGSVGVFAGFNIIVYLHLYFVHLNPEFSQSWQYGYKQAVEYTMTNKAKYKKIVVSTKLEQPHMFFLFYLKYDPKKYLEEGGTKSGGFAEIRNKFDKYEFRPINWDKEIRDGTILYIATPGEVSSSGLLTINYLDGQNAIKLADR